MSGRCDLQKWGELRDFVVESVRAGHTLTTTARGEPITAELHSVDPERVWLLLSLPGEKLQFVELALIHLDEKEKWLALRTPVCEEHALVPRDALIRNFRFVVGHLELEPERRQYWYRQNIPLRDVDAPWSQVTYTLVVLAGVGDSLESELTGLDRW